MTCVVFMLSAGSISMTAQATSCNAIARYLKAEARDAKGFKQAVTLGVSTRGAAHGLINYTVTYADKSGAAQTKATNATYQYDPAVATEVTLTDGEKIQEIQLVDDTVLAASACSEAKPCVITGVRIDKTSCFVDR